MKLQEQPFQVLATLLGEGASGQDHFAECVWEDEPRSCSSKGTSKVTVGVWRRRFLAHGVRGLYDELRPSPAGRAREFAKLSSCSPCSASKTSTAFGRPIAIGTSIVHGRCPDSQQY